MAQRRSDITLTPQELLESVLYRSFTWAPKTVSLERETVGDYKQRSMSSNVSVSELYHENSKLFPQMLAELAATRVAVDELRSVFVHRQVAKARAAGGETAVKPPWLRLVEAAARSTDPAIFYSLELRVVTAGELLQMEPCSGAVHAVRNVPDDDLVALRRAVRLLEIGERAAESRVLVFVVGCFARNELLFGPRGYRRTLMEVGRFVEAVLSRARGLGLAALARYEFADRTIEGILHVDGVEHGVLAVVEME